MTFVIRSAAGFYYHGIGGLGHRVFCDQWTEAKSFATREEAGRVKAEIDVIRDEPPNQRLMGLEVVSVVSA